METPWQCPCIHTLGVIPLINTLTEDLIKQVWYADDAIDDLHRK